MTFAAFAICEYGATWITWELMEDEHLKRLLGQQNDNADEGLNLAAKVK